MVQISHYGRQVWCLRFEARFFKIRNFYSIISNNEATQYCSVLDKTKTLQSGKIHEFAKPNEISALFLLGYSFFVQLNLKTSFFFFFTAACKEWLYFLKSKWGRDYLKMFYVKFRSLRYCVCALKKSHHQMPLKVLTCVSLCLDMSLVFLINEHNCCTQPLRQELP